MISNTMTGDSDYKDHLVSFRNILRHELLYFLWALMEIAIIVPLILAFAPWARFWPPGVVALLFLLLMLIPFNISRLASLFQVPIEKQQIVVVVALILTLLIAWRTLLFKADSIIDFGWLKEFFSHLSQGNNPFWSRDVLIFVTILLAWWRGISLVGRRLDIGEIGLRFRTGILLIVFLVAGLAGSQLSWSVTPFILLFFFASLMAIILTRVEQLERSYSGNSFPIKPKWLLIVIGASTLTTFLIGLIAGLISSDSILGVIGWFGPLWLAANFLVASAIIPVSVLSTPFLTLFGWFLSWLFGIIGSTLQLGLLDIQLSTQQPLATPSPEELTEATEAVNFVPRQLLPLLVMLFFILLVALALGGFFRALRQPAQFPSESMDPLSKLGQLQRPGIGRRLLHRLGSWRRWRTAASIRHIYRAMCRLAADRGYPRAEYETPYEYLSTLAQAWPNHILETTIITEAFTRVRYGEIPESEEELNEIIAAWKRLEEIPPQYINADLEGEHNQVKRARS